MKKDKNIIILFELSLSIILLCMFLTTNCSKFLIALFLAVFAFITAKVLKFNKTLTINRKMAIYIMGAFAILYVLVLYLLGIYAGFYNAILPMSLNTIINFILPLVIIITSSEFIRQRFLSQEIKYNNLLTLLPMVLVDVILNIKNYDLTNSEEFLGLIGYVIFVSIANNLLFNYISKKYGKAPNIAYRLITRLYVYIIPITPDIHILIETLIKMLFPYFIYRVFENQILKTTVFVPEKQKRRNRIIGIILVVIMLMITMLISCKFEYGILVVGSESMTGTIDKGDAIVFVQYKEQKIKNDDILIFNSEGRMIIHRVVDIKNVNNEKRYYTKGDANSQNDDGYVTNAQIIGVYKFRVKDIGYLTLLFNNMFKK